MNAKEAKKLRREARGVWSKREDRMHKDAYLIHSKGKREYETKETNPDGTRKKMELAVYGVRHHPDSLRGIYRFFKKLAKRGRE